MYASRLVFFEVIYKDSMEPGFIDNMIPFLSEEERLVFYKGQKLKHRVNTNFLMVEDTIVEVKSGDDGIIVKTV